MQAENSVGGIWSKSKLAYTIKDADAEEAAKGSSSGGFHPEELVHPDTAFVEELVIQVIRGNPEAALAKLRARGRAAVTGNPLLAGRSDLIGAAAGIGPDGVPALADPTPLDQIPIESLPGFSTRTKESLDRAGLIYAADVLAKTPQQLRGVCGLSWAQIEETKKVMGKLLKGRDTQAIGCGNLDVPADQA